ncbi:hypothetical protein [Massilia sp. TSP1-1-2]|uniref:hypothetical protein n=1 Tax=Massilia sp. TSP1-1-2 TaxID=2804649 RepID=UPI003CF8FEA5
MSTTLIISPPRTRDSFVAKLFAFLTSAPPIPPAPTFHPVAAAGAGPHCPLVVVQLLAHPSADHLQVAHFAGGSVVVPRGYFNNGELAVFIPEGAHLPEYLLKRANLWNHTTGYGALRGREGNRVAWKKVQGVLSYGVLIKALNDPDPLGEPSAMLFGPRGDWSSATMFTEGECCARFLAVQ